MVAIAKWPSNPAPRLFAAPGPLVSAPIVEQPSSMARPIVAVPVERQKLLEMNPRPILVTMSLEEHGRSVEQPSILALASVPRVKLLQLQQTYQEKLPFAASNCQVQLEQTKDRHPDTTSQQKLLLARRLACC